MARGGAIRRGLKIGLAAGVGAALVRAARARRAATPSVAQPTWPPLPTALADEPPAAMAAPQPTATDSVVAAVEPVLVAEGTAGLVAEAAALEAAGVTEAAEVDQDAAAALRGAARSGEGVAPAPFGRWAPPAPESRLDSDGDVVWAPPGPGGRDGERTEAEQVPGEAIDQVDEVGEEAETGVDMDALLLAEEAALEAERLEAERMELARLTEARTRAQEDETDQARRERERQEALARFSSQREEAQLLLSLQEEREANARPEGEGPGERQPLMAGDLDVYELDEDDGVAAAEVRPPGPMGADQVDAAGRRGPLDEDERTSSVADPMWPLEVADGLEPAAQLVEEDALEAPSLEPVVPDEAVADLDEDPAWGIAAEAAPEPMAVDEVPAVPAETWPADEPGVEPVAAAPSRPSDDEAEPEPVSAPVDVDQPAAVTTEPEPQPWSADAGRSEADTEDEAEPWLAAEDQDEADPWLAAEDEDEADPWLAAEDEDEAEPWLAAEDEDEDEAAQARPEPWAIAGAEAAAPAGPEPWVMAEDEAAAAPWLAEPLPAPMSVAGEEVAAGALEPEDEPWLDDEEAEPAATWSEERMDGRPPPMMIGEFVEPVGLVEDEDEDELYDLDALADEAVDADLDSLAPVEPPEPLEAVAPLEGVEPSEAVEDVDVGPVAAGAQTEDSWAAWVKANPATWADWTDDDDDEPDPVDEPLRGAEPAGGLGPEEEALDDDLDSADEEEVVEDDAELAPQPVGSGQPDPGDVVEEELEAADEEAPLGDAGWVPIPQAAGPVQRRPLMTGDFDDVLPETLEEDEHEDHEDEVPVATSPPLRRSGRPRVPLKARRATAAEDPGGPESSHAPTPPARRPGVRSAKEPAGTAAAVAKPAPTKVSSRRGTRTAAATTEKPAAAAAAKAPSKKAPSKKAASKQAPSKKAASKQPASKQPASKKPAAKKAAATKKATGPAKAVEPKKATPLKKASAAPPKKVTASKKAAPTKTSSAPASRAPKKSPTTKVAVPARTATKATKATNVGQAKPEKAPKRPARTKKADVIWVEPVGDTCPPTHPVKASVSRGIFHVVGGLFYERSQPERCYRVSAAAEADGLRQAKR